MADSPVRWQRYLQKVNWDSDVFPRTPVCLYSNGRIIILYYVDDLTLFARREYRVEADEVKRQLNARLDVCDCGKMRWFMGMRVIRDRAQRKLWLLQDACDDRCDDTGDIVSVVVFVIIYLIVVRLLFVIVVYVSCVTWELFIASSTCLLSASFFFFSSTFVVL